MGQGSIHTALHTIVIDIINVEITKLSMDGVQDFHMIASFLDHRSTQDCVQFYYKTQKLDEFAAVRRKQQLKKMQVNLHRRMDSLKLLHSSHRRRRQRSLQGTLSV